MRQNSGRVKLDVPVAVIVQNQSDEIVLPAQTVDASAFGARIKDFTGNVYVGQKLTVIYGDKQCAFRVAWVGTGNTPWAGHIGMESLEKNKKFWDIDFGETDEFGSDALTFPWELKKFS